MNNDIVWSCVQSSNPSEVKQAEHTNIHKRQLALVTEELFHYLIELHKDYCVEVTLSLSMKSSTIDQRLMRGMNEIGFIEPDFGKKFLGLYFNHLSFTFIPLKGTSKAKEEFLIPYFRGLISRYFSEHPTDYSNWECSAKYGKNKSNFLTRNSASRVINFPYITVSLA